MLQLHKKIWHNYQQIMKLLAAYKTRKQFDMELNGSNANLYRVRTKYRIGNGMHVSQLIYVSIALICKITAYFIWFFLSGIIVSLMSL